MVERFCYRARKIPSSWLGIFWFEVEDRLGYSVERLKTSEPLGVSIVVGIKRSSAAIVVFGWWILFVLLKVAGAAISG